MWTLRPCLALQVQSHSAGRQVLEAFRQLSDEDQRVLAFEMALSGLPGQAYARGAGYAGGPALLVYYSPAFLRGAVRHKAIIRFIVR